MTKVGLQISVLPEKEVCKLPVILLLSLKRTMFCRFAHELKVPNYLRFILSHTCNTYMKEKVKESYQPLFSRGRREGRKLTYSEMLNRTQCTWCDQSCAHIHRNREWKTKLEDHQNAIETFGLQAFRISLFRFCSLYGLAGFKK